MPLYCPKSIALFGMLITLSGCSSRMDTNPDRLGQVRINPSSASKSGNDNNATGTQSEVSSGPPRDSSASMHEGDMATMEVVANGCTKAWRKACNGDKKGSLEMLEDLDKHYPGVLTIQMMIGQVYEHFGDNKEAVVHYSKAVGGNEFSSYHIFKLAEAMRKNGDTKGAAGCYRKILQRAPDFGAASLGLAKCLLATDKQSSEARTLLSQAKNDEQSAKEATALLDEIEPGAKAGN